MKKIHFKRIMALMLSFVMIMGAAFAMTPNVAKAASEATFTVTADKKELHRGDQFTVSVDYIFYGSTASAENLDSIMGVISLCPANKREHLEQIISHYVQAVQDKN